MTRKLQQKDTNFMIAFILCQIYTDGQGKCRRFSPASFWNGLAFNGLGKGQKFF